MIAEYVCNNNPHGHIAAIEDSEVTLSSTFRGRGITFLTNLKSWLHSWTSCEET